MTPLEALLIRRISSAGPIRLSDYMAECLLHPDHGYYTCATPFGATGDFITAPEISQMFGELLGLWLAQAWLDQGAPGAFTLAELGPGRGTLMADVLRATRGVPGFHAAARVVLVEASPRLRAVQAGWLGAGVTWADRVADLPPAPLFLLANEFFDALPVRQFTRRGRGWAETMVALRDGRLALAQCTPLPVAALAHRLDNTPEGTICEVCPDAPGIAAAIAGRIARHGGAALIVDYGGWDGSGDTVQAVRDHAFAPILATPGQADLTAHVDFAPLARAASGAGARAHGPMGQGALLDRLGINARADRLARGLTGARLTDHIAATRRLIHPDEMGTVFQALAISPTHAPVPPGFDP